MGSELDFFLTAFDPSDLPGGSIDPLGFDRGYTFLADLILPGLTNVASMPRYLSVLCAGVSLSPPDDGATPQQKRKQRREHVLRFERIWALANALAAEEIGVPPGGIRGVTYCQAAVKRLHEKNSTSAGSDFKLLSRQEPYGVLGIYGAVAEGMRFLERDTYTLTPALGEKIGEAFKAETDMPDKIARCVRNPEVEVGLPTLTEWGKRAFVTCLSDEIGCVRKGECEAIADALNSNAVRSRMAALLQKNPPKQHGDDVESELARLERIASSAEHGEYADLAAAMKAIVAFEECYRLAMLGFERLLWLCRSSVSGLCSDADVKNDKLLGSVCKRIPGPYKQLSRIADDVLRSSQSADLTRLQDARMFLEKAAACKSATELSQVLFLRHKEVQQGKYDRGRPKMPWLEYRTGGIALTSALAGGRDFEVTRLEEISPHFYRTNAADNLIAAADGHE